MMGLMERFEDFYITWYSRAKLFAREYGGEGAPDFCHEQARGEKTVPDSRGTEHFGEYRRNTNGLGL